MNFSVKREESPRPNISKVLMCWITLPLNLTLSSDINIMILAKLSTLAYLQEPYPSREFFYQKFPHSRNPHECGSCPAGSARVGISAGKNMLLLSPFCVTGSLLDFWATRQLLWRWVHCLFVSVWPHGYRRLSLHWHRGGFFFSSSLKPQNYNVDWKISPDPSSHQLKHQCGRLIPQVSPLKRVCSWLLDTFTPFLTYSPLTVTAHSVATFGG